MSLCALAACTCCSASGCPATCGGAYTCDHWIPNGYSCLQLKQDGCDCAGCAGCPTPGPTGTPTPTTGAPTNEGDTYAPTTPAPTSWPTTAAESAWVWVSNYGSDIHTCGESSNPCLTIAYALEHFPSLGECDCVSNGTVWVTAGVYGLGDGINFQGRGVMISGAEGAIIDCEGSSSGFEANLHEPPTAVLMQHLLLVVCLIYGGRG